MFKERIVIKSNLKYRERLHNWQAEKMMSEIKALINSLYPDRPFVAEIGKFQFTEGQPDFYLEVLVVNDHPSTENHLEARIKESLQKHLNDGGTFVQLVKLETGHVSHSIETQTSRVSVAY